MFRVMAAMIVFVSFFFFYQQHDQGTETKVFAFFRANTERAAEDRRQQPREITVRDAAVAAALKDKQMFCVLEYFMLFVLNGLMANMSAKTFLFAE